MRAHLVTLTTDIGPVYAAQMKAVLLHYVPPERIVDLTHDVAAHQVGEAAFLLLHMAAGFPKGTVHLAVVDPGVGGLRAPVAVRCRDGSHLVGPDNGLLDPLARALGVAQVVRLAPERVRPGRTVSRTFEGRDLFAPAAGRIALGTPIARIGDPWTLRRLDLPNADRRPDGAAGVVLHADRFGNLITNVPGSWAPPVGTQVRLGIAGRTRRLRVYETYEAMPPRGLGLLISSYGVVELAEREGPAADRLGAGVGDPVVLRWRAGQRRRK
jgi:hypothetical protein